MKKHIQCHFVIQVVIASPALEPLAKEVTNWGNIRSALIERSADPPRFVKDWEKKIILKVLVRILETRWKQKWKQDETRWVDTVLYSLSTLMNRNLVSFSGPTVSLEYFKSKDPNVKCLWYVESFNRFQCWSMLQVFAASREDMLDLLHH